jgi:hypothetical protein
MREDDITAHDNWLQDYIVESIRLKLCTRIYCSTCGAFQFRHGLLEAFAKGTGKVLPIFLHRECALSIGAALARIRPETMCRSTKLEEAVRCVLFDLWYAVGEANADNEIGSILGDSWAAEVLDKMKTHYRANEERRRVLRESQDPIRVQKRRDEKRRLREQRHLERLARKRALDRIWQEKQRRGANVIAMTERVEITSREFWFKIVEFLQRNWALIDSDNYDNAIVWFISDTAGVFDEMHFNSVEVAQRALVRNGFGRFADDAEARAQLRPPEAPFVRRAHPNGPIYSSGKFWLQEGNE